MLHTLTLGTTSPYPRHYFPLQDGQHAIKRRLALFWSKDAEFSPDEFIYVRSVAVHSVVLDAEQARARHLPNGAPSTVLRRPLTFALHPAPPCPSL